MPHAMRHHVVWRFVACFYEQRSELLFPLTSPLADRIREWTRAGVPITFRENEFVSHPKISRGLNEAYSRAALLLKRAQNAATAGSMRRFEKRFWA